MAIQFRSIGAWVAGTTSISMTMPTTHVAGDLLLMFIHTCNNAITTAPANEWQLLSPSPVSTGTANTALGVRLTVYWKIATSSSEAAQTVAVTGGTATNGFTIAYSGVDATTPFDVTPVSAVQATSLANLSFPTLTTATDGAMIVNAVALDNDTNSSTLVTSPANASLVSPTQRYGRTVSTSTGGGVCVIDGIKTTAGLISATTATVAAAARAYLTIALRPSEIKTGTFSIAGGSTVSSTGTKKSTAVASITQASTVAATAKKSVKGAYSIDQASTVATSGVKPSFDKVGSFAISHGSTVTAVGKKSNRMVAAITQASTVVAIGSKKTLSAFQIAQAQAITSTGRKISKALLQIAQASNIVFNGVKPGEIESKSGVFSIAQASSVLVAGIKRNRGILAVAQAANFASNGRKSARGSYGITQSGNVNFAGTKAGRLIANLSTSALLFVSGIKTVLPFEHIASVINAVGKIDVVLGSTFPAEPSTATYAIRNRAVTYAKSRNTRKRVYKWK